MNIPTISEWSEKKTKKMVALDLLERAANTGKPRALYLVGRDWKDVPAGEAMDRVFERAGHVLAGVYTYTAPIEDIMEDMREAER